MKLLVCGGRQYGDAATLGAVRVVPFVDATIVRQS
jgi:hypothetical protein